MNKIVELLINIDELEFDNMGVDIMSLVDKPAIGVNWQAFAEEDFVMPESGEEHDPFMSRCISVVTGEGYPSDQAAAICHSYWEEVHGPTAMEDESANIHDEILKMASSDEFGEEYDPETVVIIDGTKNEFEDIGDYLKGVRALDILGKRDLTRQAETKYRYAGPPAERNFCKAMQRLRKIYTREEIDEMDSRINTGFRHNGQPYSIFDFKGGVNCKHFWEELEVFKDGRETVMISKGPARGNAGRIASASNNYWRYPGAFAFSEDDQQIVVGPAMIPNILIPRRDAMGNLFHVFFSKDTIKEIAERFMKEQKLHNTDVNHNDEVVQENTLLESWLVEDPKRDKSSLYGFDVPKGTWMTSYKINNSETWKKIKDGELNGFSIAGNFLEKAIKN
jgi:hypothetical protein